MRDFRIIPFARSAILVSGLAAIAAAACGESQKFQGAGEGGEEATGDSGAGNEAGLGHGAAGDAAGGSGAVGGAGNAAGTGGAESEPTCKLDADCGEASSACATISCVDGECAEAPLAAETACEGGACDGAGECVVSSCESGDKDGDETGTDCGGSCELCDNGEGCASAADCRSGVCTNEECQPSACTDGVKNGTETDVDCGGGCPTPCERGKACAVDTDCAVQAGSGPHSERCLEQVCTATDPPGDGLRYWQDFEPARLRANTEGKCDALDEVCLHGNGALYQMSGLDAVTGDPKNLSSKLLFTASGAVGSGGKFDGTYCLSRTETNLSMSNMGALTVMAWVKDGRSKAPWESAIFGSMNHYMIAVDSNADRFLAAVRTNQSASFAYHSAAAAGQVTAGEWHHVAATYDSASSALVQYVDGAEVTRTELLGNVNSAVGDVLMGCREGASLSQLFIGTLDEVAVYIRALPAEELSDYVRRSRPL